MLTTLIIIAIIIVCVQMFINRDIAVRFRDRVENGNLNYSLFEDELPFWILHISGVLFGLLLGVAVTSFIKNEPYEEIVGVEKMVPLYSDVYLEEKTIKDIIIDHPVYVYKAKDNINGLQYIGVKEIGKIYITSDTNYRVVAIEHTLFDHNNIFLTKARNLFGKMIVDTDRRYDAYIPNTKALYTEK